MRLSIMVLSTLLALAGTNASAQLISEFEPNPPGGDPPTVSFEISGLVGAPFSGWVLSVESDSGTSTGIVDRASQVNGVFDANGLLVVTIDDLENPSFTVVLTDAFTGTVGTTDIDLDNDGTADNTGDLGTPWDAIGVPDNVGDETFLYGADLGGTDFAYTGREPEIIFRDYSVGALYATNLVGDPTSIYDTSGANVPDANFIFGDPELTSFGALNPSVVVPVELQSFRVE